MREALLGIRARMRAAAGRPTSARRAARRVAPTFKFCPECGAPRARVSKTFEVPTHAGAARTCCRCRSPAAPTSSRRCSRTCGARRGTRRRPARDRQRRRGPQRRCCATPTEQLADDGRVIYQVGPDPSGLAAPFYPIRSLLAAMLQLPPVSSEVELRDAVLAIGLNERDVPGIAQLFGHPTTLLELEPPVRRREMVWSTLRALERAARRTTRSRSSARTSIGSITRASRSCAARPRATISRCRRS